MSRFLETEWEFFAQLYNGQASWPFLHALPSLQR